MSFGSAVARLESSETIGQLKETMQGIVSDHGFASWCFIDAGRAYQDVPLYFGTSEDVWHDNYKNNGYVHVDPYIAKARRTNTPFDWGSITAEPRRRGPKSPIVRLMEDAADFGFKEGLIFPYHFVDDLGRNHSTVCVFYWRDGVPQFQNLVLERRLELHMSAIYFMQRAMQISAMHSRDKVALFDVERRGGPLLTDRERSVMAWAARGKTSDETADILRIAQTTVDKHIANALEKLDARNRTHGVAKCITLGLIDV